MSTITVHPVDAHVGRQIRTARRAAGLTTDQLASRIGVWRTKVDDWERGIVSLGCAELADVAEALDLPPAFFVGGRGDHDGDQPDRAGPDVILATVRAMQRLSDQHRRTVFQLATHMAAPRPAARNIGDGRAA